MYFGAPNIKSHIPPYSAVIVDDYATVDLLVAELSLILTDEQHFNALPRVAVPTPSDLVCVQVQLYARALRMPALPKVGVYGRPNARQNAALTLMIAVLAVVATIGFATEVVVSSLCRDPPSVTTASFLSYCRCSSFSGRLHVHGWNPFVAGCSLIGHRMPESLFHLGYRQLDSAFVPTDALFGSDKRAYHDSDSRAVWRSSLSLDAWHTLRSAYLRSESDVVVWLENDAIVLSCSAFDASLRQFYDSGAEGALVFWQVWACL